jgi:glycosyltransferase involved in cell wall biosynthesis
MSPASGVRVAIVTNADWYFLSHRLPIARAARDRGHEVFVVANEERDCGDRIRAEGFRFLPVPIARGSMNLLHDLATLRALRRVYREVRPRLVHHVAVKPVLYGAMAARLEKVPAIVNALAGRGHLSHAGGMRHALLRPALALAYRAAFGGVRTRAIFQNPDDLEFFVGRGVIARERAELIRGSGVDLAAYQPTPEPDGVPVILFASRLLRAKGIADLVAACDRLRARGVRCRLLIAGEPDVANPDAIPESLLRQWAAEGRAEWLGRRDDMPKVLALANVVALPSMYGEGVPKILIEAAACARAIVTTDSPGCREIVRDGLTGRLVPRNDVRALADALESLLADRALRGRMGAAGRELAAREFGEALVARRTMDLYDRMLRDAGP